MSEFRYLEKSERENKMVVSVSSLTEMMRSPKHFYSKYVLGNQVEPTKAMLDGQMIHMALLEPDKFQNQYVVADDRALYLETVTDIKTRIESNGDKPVKGKKEDLIRQLLEIEPAAKIWEVYMQQLNESGKKIISQDDFKKCQRIIEEVKKHEWLKRIPESRSNEISGYWVHPSGVHITFRLDCLFFGKGNRPVIVDVKKARDASPTEFAKAIWNNKLYIQAAVYVDAVRAITGSEPLYCWAVVEDTEPYCIEVYSADDGMLGAGNAVYTKLLNKYVECYQTNKWNGYTDGKVNPIALPHWAFSKLDEYADQELEFDNQ
jgi:hypothetical protein